MGITPITQRGGKTMYNPIFEEEIDRKERKKELKGLKNDIKKRSGSNPFSDVIRHVYDLVRKNGIESWFEKDDALIEVTK